MIVMRTPPNFLRVSAVLVPKPVLLDVFVPCEGDGLSFGLSSLLLVGPGSAQYDDTSRFSGFFFLEGGQSITDEEFAKFNGYDSKGKSFG